MPGIGAVFLSYIRSTVHSLSQLFTSFLHFLLCRGWKVKQVCKRPQLIPSRLEAVGMGMNSYGVYTVWINKKLREISALSIAQTCSRC